MLLLWRLWLRRPLLLLLLLRLLWLLTSGARRLRPHRHTHGRCVTTACTRAHRARACGAHRHRESGRIAQRGDRGGGRGGGGGGQLSRGLRLLLRLCVCRDARAVLLVHGHGALAHADGAIQTGRPASVAASEWKAESRKQGDEMTQHR